ncbi:MAG TPA: hypothetical protein VFA55_03945 [Candidatus Kapabacteria bacterium]|nr:hypothetical protein [Candidatus Kapabacteria bacterium]
MKTVLHFCCACALALLFFAGFAGCASTNIASSTDPAYAGKSFKKIVVFADTSDLVTRAELETKFVQDCKDNGIEAAEWLQLYPATRTYSDSSRDAVLKENGIDGFLDVTFVKTGYMYNYGDTPSPWAKIQATLYDDSNWKTAWIASLTSELHGTNGFADPYSTLITSFCQKMEEQLVKDGLIKKAEGN